MGPRGRMGAFMYVRRRGYRQPAGWEQLGEGLEPFSRVVQVEKVGRMSGRDPACVPWVVVGPGRPVVSGLPHTRLGAVLLGLGVGGLRFRGVTLFNLPECPGQALGCFSCGTARGPESCPHSEAGGALGLQLTFDLSRSHPIQ